MNADQTGDETEGTAHSETPCLTIVRLCDDVGEEDRPDVTRFYVEPCDIGDGTIDTYLCRYSTAILTPGERQGLVEQPENAPPVGNNNPGAKACRDSSLLGLEAAHHYGHEAFVRISHLWTDSVVKHNIAHHVENIDALLELLAVFVAYFAGDREVSKHAPHDDAVLLVSLLGC